jgi:hypothetical protein
MASRMRSLRRRLKARSFSGSGRSMHENEALRRKARPANARCHFERGIHRSPTRARRGREAGRGLLLGLSVWAFGGFCPGALHGRHSGLLAFGPKGLVAHVPCLPAHADLDANDVDPENTLPLEGPWADGVWPAVKASAYDPLEREPGTDREGDGGVRHLQVERLCAVGPLRLAEEENA